MMQRTVSSLYNNCQPMDSIGASKKNVTIGSEYIIPFFSNVLKHEPTNEKRAKPFFVIGDRYKLSGADCDDFTMPEKEYELVAVLDKVNDIILESVVMKQVSGDNGTIFSLTKLDCKNLKIDFQRGLQIFPKNLNWEHQTTEITDNNEEEVYEFDSSLLRTYPRNYHDKAIHLMTIKISGFRIHTLSSGQTIIHAPNNVMSTEQGFLGRLSVKTIRPIGVASNIENASFPQDWSINYRCITSQVSRLHRGSHIIDEDGCMFLELNLERINRRTNSKVGIDPEIFGDASFNDVFEVSIADYLKGTTLEDYARRTFKQYSQYTTVF